MNTFMKICVLCPIFVNAVSSEDDIVIPENYEKEVEAGKVPDMFGSNPHSYVPSKYPEFSRRFVPFYKYSEKKKQQAVTGDLKALLQLDLAIKEALNGKMLRDINEVNGPSQAVGEIIPKRAAPEVVFDLAAEGAVIEASRPKNIDIMTKDALRTGDYWNGLWKEDVPFPEQSLRSEVQPKLDSVRVKIMPGSQLYTLVKMAMKVSPDQLLYVIKDQEF